MQQVSVIGLGKAGLPLAAVISDIGIKVVGVDLNKKLVNKINSKENPIPGEEGLQELLDKNVGKSFFATTDFEDVKDSTIYIVIVPLFIDEKHKPDFSILEKAFLDVAKVLKKGDLVVLETTVPPKTTETKVKFWLEKSGLIAGSDFYLAYSPERIMTGKSISRYKEFPKVVGGIDEASGENAYKFYSKFCSKVDKVKNVRTAELIKVAEGVYRDVNIALANELYKVSDELDVDFWEMREKANHTFCNIHEAGIGVGGHCIPVYPWFLINEFEVPLVKGARLLNDGMVEYWVEKVKARKPKKVLLVGLAYRIGVKETAYARSFVMIKRLKKEGFEVYGLDPMYSVEETKRIFGVGRSENVKEMDIILLGNKGEESLGELKKFKDKIMGVKLF